MLVPFIYKDSQIRWDYLEERINLEFIQKFKEVLTGRQTIRILEEKRKPSSVLIPQYYSEGQHYLIFTKRTTLVRYHKGEISFPGGGYLKEDGNMLNTALREAREEIGLEPGDVDILGELDDGLTVGSQFIITPFVGAIPPDYEFKLNSYEIEEIIQIPIPVLLGKSCIREESMIYEGKPLKLYFYSYKNHLITGATARILRQFLDIYSQVSDVLRIR
jgi:8-oxo-dGTP pyrophosphatase MutT (NUDIX family)